MHREPRHFRGFDCFYCFDSHCDTATHPQGWFGLPPSPFAPVVECGVAAPFLNETPRNQWAGRRAAPVPLLLGLSRSEGLQTLAPWPSGGTYTY